VYASDVAEEFCLAALLHDVGHFPFSHSFESVAKSHGKDLKHEKYSEELILHSEISDRLSKVDVNPKHVVEFLKGTYLREPRFRFLNMLLSSELDIDRLDFLLRDSYYCGVMYGTYDLDRLILSMQPYRNQEVVISRKGIQSVEMYVLARFSMYLQVYAHHTRRAFDLMLQSLFAKRDFENLGYPKPTKNEINGLEGFDDNWLLRKIKEIPQNTGNSRSRLARQFLKREPIKWVCECQAFTDVFERGKRTIPAYTTLSDFCRSLKNRQIDSSLKVPIDEIWGDDLFGDLPFQNRYRPVSYTSESEKGIIRVLNSPQDEPRDIADNPSSLASFLARNMVQIVRVYTLERNRTALVSYLKKKCDKEGIIWCPTE